MPAAPQPPDPDQILAWLAAALAPLVESEKGRLDVAGDPQAALEMLATAPAGWRVVLIFSGHGPSADGSPDNGAYRFAAVVQRARGLDAANGGDVWAETARGRSLLGLVSLVSRWIRAGELDEARDAFTTGFFIQTGGQWLTLETPETRQYQLDFEIEVQFPSPEE